MKTSKFVDSIIEEVNPLELPKEDGTGYVWHSMVDCYLYVMNRLLSLSPNAYLDMYLIIAKLWNVSFVRAKDDYHNCFHKFVTERKQFMMLDDPKAKSFFRMFLMGAHRKTGTTFNAEAFRAAFDLFQEHIQYERNNKVIK